MKKKIYTTPTCSIYAISGYTSIMDDVDIISGSSSEVDGSEGWSKGTGGSDMWSWMDDDDDDGGISF